MKVKKINKNISRICKAFRLKEVEEKHLSTNLGLQKKKLLLPFENSEEWNTAGGKLC
jgi:hypothetical protein